MSNKQAALEYTTIGWHVFPVYEISDDGNCSCRNPECEHPGKHPRVINGLHDGSTDPAQVSKWWDKWPNANIGIRTGAESGITVIDIDDMDKKQLYDIPKTVSSRTGSGGEHHIFMHPGEPVKTGVKIVPGLDSRGDGGYIIVPPSNHKSGGRYEWIEAPFFGCEVGPVPQWWLQAIKDKDQERRKKMASPVADALPEGGRNQGVFDFGVSIWKKVPIPENVLFSALMTYNNDVCKPPLDEQEVATIAASIVRYEGKTKEEWERDEELAKEGAMLADMLWESHQRKIANALVNKVEKNAGPPPDFMPSSGLIREIADYILSQSERPLPLLAVSAAACFIGVLAGGRYEATNTLGPNLMFINLAGSGSGKQKARTIISRIAYELDLMHYMGAEDVASAPGMIAELVEHPSKLFLMDEFGLALQSITNKNASGSKREIMATIMKLYSSYGTVYHGTAYADKKNRPKNIIKSPCLVIYGTSTHGQFYKALTSEQGADGFISRLLVLPYDGERENRVKVKYHGTPRELKARITEYAGLQFPDGKHVVRMADGIEDAIIDLDNSMTSLMIQYPDIKDTAESVYSRVAENTTKLALVYAISMDFTDPVIDYKAYQWAREIALWCANHIMEKLVENLADNEIERDHKKMIRYVNEAGLVGCTKRDLQRRFLKLKAFDRDEMIGSLISLGFIFEKDGRLYGADCKEDPVEHP